MTKYRYDGPVDRIFPSIKRVVKSGEEFDGPEGLQAPGLSIIADKKIAPAVETKKENNKSETKKVTGEIVGE